MDLFVGKNGAYLHDYLRDVREWRRVMEIPKEVAVTWVKEGLKDFDLNGMKHDMQTIFTSHRWHNKLWVCVGHEEYDSFFTVIYNHDGAFWLYLLREKEQ